MASLNEIKNYIQNKLGDVTVVEQEVNKNNGVKLLGITIRKPDEIITPVIYINDLLEGELSNEEIANHIIDVYLNNPAPVELDIKEMVQSFELIKDYITLVIINLENNLELLEGLVHEKFLDLAILPIIDISKDETCMTIKVSKNIKSIWNVDDETIFKTAYDNFLQKDVSVVESMMEILSKMGLDLDVEVPLRMYTITNKKKVYGASRILDKQALKDLADKFDDDFYILPSSIHECILIPCEECSNEEYLNEMVNTVNNDAVAQDEILGDHIYKYVRGSGNIESILS